MKRFLKTVLAASVIAFSAGITSSAIYVPPYPEYLNEDSSYPLVYGHMGVGEYVDLGSIYIIRQDDSGIEFKVSVVYYDYDKDTMSTGVSHFFKRYSDPNSLYYSAWRKEKYSPEEWRQGDLSNTSGYMQSANKTFLTCMEQITGEPYRY